MLPTKIDKGVVWICIVPWSLRLWPVYLNYIITHDKRLLAYSNKPIGIFILGKLIIGQDRPALFCLVSTVGVHSKNIDTLRRYIIDINER